MRSLILFVTILITLTNFALADKIYLENLVIDNVWIKDTPPNHPLTAGYLTIENRGPTKDTLIFVSSPFSDKGEIHTMIMEKNVMKMRPMIDGLIIPSGEIVQLRPGSFHLMFTGLNQQMVPLDNHLITLLFKNAGAITVQAIVKPLKSKASSGHSDQTHLDLKYQKF
ncbi:copper chaperone PCu(A)C [Alphaproteobacteria bacterium]|nr:copper chaperone PCu(A)C [Alphaproteobacteria bacterium]MDA9815946.1 copper chaperone PCu(A)C [Alphaproteobacteria bacterium]MDC0394332.1 copper chaperone PCu(A)C [Alphaproteobacteria bacterium]MDC0461622.1 copper chaperone PCu(A)C [Alphaproteobacteria bacterium]